MILAIGIDSFDTPFSGCTTHFSSILLLVLAKRGYQAADYPWLVRLNPAVPWKTRGNGAIALHLYVDNRRDAQDALRMLRELAKKYNISPKASYIALLRPEDDIREYLENRPECITDTYERALHEIVTRDLVHECIRGIKDNVVEVGGLNNRGIVGALSSLGMKLDDYTFELTMYRSIDRWGSPRRIDAESVIRFDIVTKPYTFLNIDYTIGKILIAPHGYDPVLYAVRGERPDILLKALSIIDPGEKPSHGVLHRSNQATDAHLYPRNTEEIRPYDNPIVTGVIKDYKWLPGGHLLANMCDETGCIDVAFYRETRWLRHHAVKVAKNYLVEIGGQAKPHRGGVTLNAEYIMVKGCTRESKCTYRGPVLLRPPPSTFHHLMRPPERRPVESKELRFPSSIDDILSIPY